MTPMATPRHRPTTDCNRAAPSSALAATRSAIVAFAVAWPAAGHAAPPAMPSSAPVATVASGRAPDAGGNVAAAPVARPRIALSHAADKRLAELRLRRLLAIELGRKVQLEHEQTGPLGDDLVQVWVDLADERIALQVRRMGRTLARRTVDISGYPSEVAARMVALEASEMIRVQVGALPADPCGTCRLRAQDAPSELASFAALGSAAVRFTPSGDLGLLAGPRLELGHQHGRVRQLVYGEWLVATDSATDTRWLGAGIGIDVRIPLGKTPTPLQLAVGARTGLAALRSRGASPALDDWTATATTRVAAELALRPHVWLGLAVEPGLVVRPIDDRVAGFTLGGALTIAAGPTD